MPDRPAPERRLLLTLSGEISLKSAQTRRRFERILRSNLEGALAERAPGATVVDKPRGRLSIVGDDLGPAADVAAGVFGLHRIEVARRVDSGSLESLVAEVGALFEPRVAGKRFAVRARLRDHEAQWRRTDLERALGDRLLAASAGVDLGHPEVTVHVHLWGQQAFVIEDQLAGAGGLPLGTQAPLLSLFSGGFDSPVATWMLMRRGSPVDLVHFMMECAQSDHALGVAYELWRRWGAGSRPRAWVVDFTEAKDALLRHVHSHHRQVVLKKLMFSAAATLARAEALPALVTGESVGQVSTQTVENLAEIDRSHGMTVLRPLAGFTKDEIIEWSRRIGTESLSATSKEVCNLARGWVETRGRGPGTERAVASLPEGIVARAVAGRRVLSLPLWQPGLDPVPVVEAAPAGVPLVPATGPLPPSGPVALIGQGSVEAATAARRSGRTVWVVAGRHHGPLASLAV